MVFYVSLRNFRAFDSASEVPIRPITLLTGANSAGKTSFLAALRYLSDISPFGADVSSFNKAPFSLGAYEQIAHHFGSGNDDDSHFCLGYRGPLADDRFSPSIGRPTDIEPKECEFTILFKRHLGQPTISEFSFRAGKRWALQLKIDANWNRVSVAGKAEDTVVEKTGDIPQNFRSEQLSQRPALVQFLVDQILSEADQHSISSPRWMLARQLTGYLQRSITAVPPTSFVGAPVRSRPSRTYDPSETATSPEGAHVPSRLAQIARTSPNEWHRLRSSLSKFGAESGLFTDIEIRSLGLSDSDPFQLHVLVSGAKRNLIDVGYGVSQAIPVVFELLRRVPQQMFLVQQPEVHLHPEAQAALGSLIAAEANRVPGYIIIETHSDYLIDRIRRLIREGVVSRDDVSLLYFDRVRDFSRIEEIGLDERGEVVSAPDRYRAFFLKEQLANLGFADVPDS